MDGTPGFAIGRPGHSANNRIWLDAIRGDGPAPGSNFDHASDLTEMVLLGVIARRFGGRIEYDSVNMRITNRPDLNQHPRIKAREERTYGKGI